MTDSVFMGIDVSKGYADFSVLDARKREVIKPFQLYDVAPQHQALGETVKKMAAEYHAGCIYAAVESTGGYENHWLETLERLAAIYPVLFARLNPIGVSKHRQAEMREQITDKQSSKAIATYLVNYHDRINFNHHDPYLNHRIVLSNIEMLTKQLIQDKNRLRQYLYLYFPEILPYCRNDLRSSVLKLITKYPSSAKMAAFVNRKSTKPSYLVSEELLALKQQCKQSIASAADPLIESMISDNAAAILALQQRIDKLFTDLYKVLPKDKLDILMSMPGVGVKTAIVVQCVLGNIDRFENVHQLLGYLGFYPINRESGDGKRKPKLSRKGNVLIRKHLYMAALTATRSDQYLKSIYEASIDHGMCRKAALVKIMSKMMSMLYGMLKNQENYNPQIDAARREKYTPHAAANVPLPANKVTMADTQILISSPISKKHANIRKEQTLAMSSDSKSTSLPAAPPDFLSENILEESPDLVKKFLDL